jgi:hypothetical protein
MMSKMRHDIIWHAYGPKPPLGYGKAFYARKGWMAVVSRLVEIKQWRLLPKLILKPIKLRVDGSWIDVKINPRTRTIENCPQGMIDAVWFDKIGEFPLPYHVVTMKGCKLSFSGLDLSWL